MIATYMRKETVASACKCAGALVAFLSWMVGGGIASALEPPQPGEVEGLAARDDLADRLSFARQLNNHRIDPFLLQRAIARAGRQALEERGEPEAAIERLTALPVPPPAWRGMPSTGNVRVLALLVEFQDETHTNSRDFIHARLFGAGDPAQQPYESLAAYYERASYQQLDLSQGNTLGWYKTANDRTAVPQTDTGRENLIKEIINHFNSQGHDFSQYDNDNNGVVDYFLVIWTGPDNGWANFWWGYMTVFGDQSFTVDGKRLGRYSWQWEARPTGTAFTPRVVIHETGHALGLPDLYDYDPAVGPGGGVGGLDMMDANRGDHNCFSKWVLDWLMPTVVAMGSQALTLDASGDAGDCVAIWPGLASGDLFSELFVAQNRQRVSNDSVGMPADGMLIWHVDAELNASGTDFAWDNSFTAHKLLRLMEADGLEQIEAGSPADAGDYYRTGAAFGPATTPSSQAYDGSDTGVQVTGFSGPGSQMSATFAVLAAAAGGSCSLCYTCGGAFPAFGGALPTREGAEPWERGAACAGNPVATADNWPYLCCKAAP
jgi:M6 family metalloprotease-like protein